MFFFLDMSRLSKNHQKRGGLNFWWVAYKRRHATRKEQDGADKENDDLDDFPPSLWRSAQDQEPYEEG